MYGQPQLYQKIIIKGVWCIFLWFHFLRILPRNDSIGNREEGSCDDEYDSLEECYSDEEFEDDENSRTAENAKTMNKMAELKKQLQNLSMTRKNKQVYEVYA